VGYLQQCLRELCYYKSVLFYVVLDEDHGVDYTDTSITLNTRGAYPIEFIENAKIPCLAGHPTDVIFLRSNRSLFVGGLAEAHAPRSRRWSDLPSNPR
jgi:ATP-dependent phosphoenolpyruvate carboxykinase